MKIKFGFTLAEILITLGIIGVVASVTIPGLIVNIDVDGKANAATLKKTISAINDATKMIVMLETKNRSMTTAPANTENLYKKYLHTSKSCAKGNPGNCVSTDVGTGKATYKNKDGTESAYTIDMTGKNGPIYVLSDSTLVMVNPFSGGACTTTTTALYDPEAGPKSVKNVCFVINIDVNGAKKPNQPGVDRFQIPIGKQGVKLSGEELKK